MTITKIKLDNINSVDPIATATPTASKIPIADGSGKIDDGWLSINALNKSKVQKSFIAGETLTASNALIVGTASTILSASYEGTETGTTDTLTATEWRSNTFTTTKTAKAINKVVIGINSVSKTFTFATPVPVSPNTSYCVISRYINPNVVVSIRAFNGTVPTGADIGEYTASANTGSGAIRYQGYGDYTITRGGQKVGATSANAGVSWSATTSLYAETVDGNDLEIFELNTESGKLYKASAQYNTEFVTNFIGFADENITSGGTGLVNLGGVKNNLTGLVVGTTYYLSDTPGEIATSAGTNSKKVGMGISTTELLIKNEN